MAEGETVNEDNASNVTPSMVYKALNDSYENAEYLTVYYYNLDENNSVDLSKAKAIYYFSPSGYYKDSGEGVITYDYETQEKPMEHIKSNLSLSNLSNDLAIDNPLSLTISNGSIDGKTYIKAIDSTNNSNWYFNDDFALEYIRRNDCVIKIEFNVEHPEYR